MSKFLKIGTNRCECGACGERFGGITTFDIHRVGVHGDRSCMSSRVMRDRGLTTKIWNDGTVYWSKPFGNLPKSEK